jgi:hypothetical protein
MIRLLTALMIPLFSIITSLNFEDTKSEAAQEKLFGRVKSIRYEVANLSRKAGQWVEGKRTLQRTVIYDEKGNWKEEKASADIKGVADFDRQSDTRIIYRYDKKGQRSETVTRLGDEDNARLFRREFKHDAKGNRTEEVVYGKTLIYSEDNTYKGNVLGGETILGIYTHTYDADDNRVVTEWRQKGLLTDKWVYISDSRGLTTELTHYKGSHELAKEAYEYEFDAAGNWVKRTRSKWGNKDGGPYLEPKDVTYRIIVYF